MDENNMDSLFTFSQSFTQYMDKSHDTSEILCCIKLFYNRIVITYTRY